MYILKITYGGLYLRQTFLNVFFLNDAGISAQFNCHEYSVSYNRQISRKILDIFLLDYFIATLQKVCLSYGSTQNILCMRILSISYDYCFTIVILSYAYIKIMVYLLLKSSISII